MLSIEYHLRQHPPSKPIPPYYMGTDHPSLTRHHLYISNDHLSGEIGNVFHTAATGRALLPKAHATLCSELVQQLKALWTTTGHYCVEHQVEFRRYEPIFRKTAPA